MTLRIVVCHISFLKFEYFTQRRGEAEYAEAFTTQILIITLRSRLLFTSARDNIDFLSTFTNYTAHSASSRSIFSRNARMRESALPRSIALTTA